MVVRAKGWHFANALVDIDFARNRAFFDGIYFNSVSDLISSANASFSRASHKWFEAANGDHFLFPANTPARDARGILLENAATELIPRNHITGETPAVGAGALAISGWGQVGGATGFAEILPEQDVLGISTQPQAVNGGDAAGYQGWKTASTLPHTPGDYTLSIAARRAAGKTACDIFWYAPVGLSGAHLIASAAELTDEWQIFSLSQTAIASGSATCQIIKTQQLDASYGVEFALPMLREGPASSPVLTTGTSISHAADDFHLNLNDGSYNASYVLANGSTIERTEVISGGGGFTLPLDLSHPLLSRVSFY
jgi:hypothetical protein